jgi:hypothetical protein
MSEFAASPGFWCVVFDSQYRLARGEDAPPPDLLVLDVMPVIGWRTTERDDDANDAWCRRPVPITPAGEPDRNLDYMIVDAAGADEARRAERVQGMALALREQIVQASEA